MNCGRNESCSFSGYVVWYFYGPCEGYVLFLEEVVRPDIYLVSKPCRVFEQMKVLPGTMLPVRGNGLFSEVMNTIVKDVSSFDEDTMDVPLGLLFNVDGWPHRATRRSLNLRGDSAHIVLGDIVVGSIKVQPSLPVWSGTVRRLARQQCMARIKGFNPNTLSQHLQRDRTGLIERVRALQQRLRGPERPKLISAQGLGPARYQQGI